MREYDSIEQEIMVKHDRLIEYGRVPRLTVRDEITVECARRGVKESVFGGRAEKGHEQAYLDILNEFWEKWHTTKEFKVGDKVYVLPSEFPHFRDCIRGTVTEVSTDGWGYHLRAFQEDLPGIYMFNQWDKDLIPRVGKSRKVLSEAEFNEWKRRKHPDFPPWYTEKVKHDHNTAVD